MSTIDDGGPAFPPNGGWTEDRRPHDGMSLRDYAAIKAMAGALAGVPGSHLEPRTLARYAYEYADAMLSARNKES